MASNAKHDEVLRLDNVILSYPRLFSAEADDNGNMKYSTTVIITKDTPKEQVALAKKVCQQLLKKQFGDDFAVQVKDGDLSYPFGKSATKIAKKGYDAVGAIDFFGSTSQRKPGVVSNIPDKDGRPTPITDESLVYAGVVANVTFNAFTYANKKKGVSMGLRNVQIIGDGTRLDGGKSAQDEFEAKPLANLDDLEQDSSDENESSDGIDELLA